MTSVINSILNSFINSVGPAVSNQASNTFGHVIRHTTNHIAYHGIKHITETSINPIVNNISVQQEVSRAIQIFLKETSEEVVKYGIKTVTHN
jgi:hypothetical protein